MNSATYKNLAREAERLCDSAGDTPAATMEEGLAKIEASLGELKKEAEAMRGARDQLGSCLGHLVLAKAGVDRAVAALEQEHALVQDDIEDIGNMVAELKQALEKKRKQQQNVLPREIEDGGEESECKRAKTEDDAGET